MAMADATIEDLYPCGCCLRRAQESTQTSRKNVEIYWTMLKECFNIQVTEPSEECGICQQCEDRLLDANDFKLQVQRSQANLKTVLGRTPRAMREGVLDIKFETIDEGTSNDPLKITPEFNVDVVIKEEPEEVNSSADATYDEAQGGSSATDALGDVQDHLTPGLERTWTHEAEGSTTTEALTGPAEHFLLKGDGPSTSASGEESNAATASTFEPSNEQNSENKKKKHTCKICGKTFSFVGSLKRHIRLHTGEKRFACEVCDKSFSQACHLQEHRLIHTGVKPHTCKKCNKNFTHKNSLIQHVKLHETRERPYVCEVCKKDFARLGALKTHERIHTGEKPYSCDICYKAFVLPEGLRRHKFTHTNEKPFECEVCQKRFTDTGDLKRHMRIHTGEKPYKCDFCDKKFAQLSNLKQHTLIHTGDKPHVCEVCQRAFTKSSHLKVHKKLHKQVLDEVAPAVICKIEVEYNEEGDNIDI